MRYAKSDPALEVGMMIGLAIAHEILLDHLRALDPDRPPSGAFAIYRAINAVEDEFRLVKQRRKAALTEVPEEDPLVVFDSRDIADPL